MNTPEAPGARIQSAVGLFVLLVGLLVTALAARYTKARADAAA